MQVNGHVYIVLYGCVYTGTPDSIALRRYCIFYKLKVCGKPAFSDDG